MTIRITARLNDDGRTVIEVDGHEGHVEQGRVCAAITAITQTCLLGLQAYAEQYPDLVSMSIEKEHT